jgi:hypothetical protein
MRRVAIYTYWYPPARSVASLRLTKFAKYLPSFGWDPYIFTIDPVSSRYLTGPLPDDAPAGRVHRVPDPSLHVYVDRLQSRLPRTGLQGSSAVAPRRNAWLVRAAYRVYREVFCFPDEAWPWLRFRPTILAASRKVEPDVVFSSSPPGTAHVIASHVAGRLGKPWVADFRDPWSHGHTLPRTSMTRFLERRLERRTLRSAAALTTVSDFIREQLETFHGKPVFVIPNGFDEAETPRSVDDDIRPDGRFSIVHTGLLYERTRRPAVFFEALDRLMSAGIVKAADIVVRFYGRNLEIAAEDLQRYPQVRPSIELHNEISYAESLAVQRRATALLLLEWPDPRARGVVTGKIFEYLAAGRPIFALGPRDGEIDRLLKRTRRGWLATTAGEMAELMKVAMSQFRRTGALEFEAGGENIDQFSRRALTGRLAQVFDRVAQ